MSRVVFVQPLLYEYPGVEALAAVLKRDGHDVRVVVGRRPAGVAKRLRRGDIAAFPVMTGTEGWALAAAVEIKRRHGCFVVLGGPHPTHSPESCLHPAVDAVCRGEGEGALADLARCLEDGRDPAAIANLWVRRGDEVVRNAVRPLIEDLDSLPPPDREAYYRDHPLLRNNPHRTFMAGRGCPYSCAFCHNEASRELYRGRGRYVRLRSPDAVLAEINAVRERWRVGTVFFHDDTFVLDRVWLEAFLPRYRDEVGLPFHCAARADTLREPTVRLLREAGCRSVSFAVESGDEALRNGVLGKGVTRAQILAAAALLKRHGIRVVTFNMLGLPGESVGQAWETVRLNTEIGADYPRCSFLTAYPGTRIAALLGTGDGCVAAAIGGRSQQSRPAAANPDTPRLRNVHAFFQTAVLFPRLQPALRLLARLPPNPLFRAWWALVYFTVFVRAEGRSPLRTLVMGWYASNPGMAAAGRRRAQDPPGF